jgi:hypothetical protein
MWSSAHTGADSGPRWVWIGVVLAVIAGIAGAVWLYGALVS